MLVVAERLNSTRKSVAPAIKERNTEFVIKEAADQVAAGGDYLDCNAATVGPEAEPDTLCWMVETVQGAVDKPCALDSPSAAAIEKALAVHKGTAMLNSITAEKAKYDALMPLARDHKTKLIALAMDDSGMPKNADERIAVARKLIDDLVRDGIELSNIFLDPLVFPVSTDPQNGHHVLNAIRAIKEAYPQINTIGGLSNVSYGLPERFIVNRAFAVLCLGAGLDAAIIDPLDKKLMSLVYAAEAILGKDDFCMGYVTAAREGKLLA
jgi:5-methyltetrahydrofolate--homocysteine methyltransferase